LKEKEQYLQQLRLLKDFDEDLSRELVAKAYQEQERKRLEVRRSESVGFKLEPSSMALGCKVVETALDYDRRENRLCIYKCFYCVATTYKKPMLCKT